MKNFYFNIALPLPIRKTFQYSHSEKIKKGSRVFVPFGSRKLVGIVIEEIKEDKSIETKSILALLDNLPSFNSKAFECIIWASKYYHHPIGEVFHSFLPNHLRKNNLHKDYAISDNNYSIVGVKPKLTDEQNNALKVYKKNSDFQVNVINGVTGSGKTEIYLRIIEKNLEKDKSTLVLVPEINLIPQLIKVFSERFRGDIGIYHSKQTPIQKYKTWQASANGNIKIIIGTRSAVMLPFKKIGSIIVDEEHDESYKQNEGFRYSARDLAIKRAQVENAPIILGSATPSISTIGNIAKKKFIELVLKKRFDGSNPPKILLYDSNEAKIKNGISAELLELIKETIAQGKQVLIFNNRRGYAPFYQCLECDWIASCNSCETNLVYHEDLKRLVCHRCESKYGIPDNCPSCSKSSLNISGVGTQRIEKYLKEEVKETKIFRIDYDTTRKKNAIENLITEINKDKEAILIGTQMLSKGHDFPNVALSIILNIDTLINNPDFNTAEKLSQLMVQVSGRVGRSRNIKDGKVIIQTRYPNDKNLLNLRDGNYMKVAKGIINDRKNFNQPPYTASAIILATSPKKESNIAYLNEVRQYFENLKLETIYGPMPSQISKLKGRYKHLVYLQFSSRNQLHKEIDKFLVISEKWSTLKKVKAMIDIDPNNFY